MCTMSRYSITPFGRSVALAVAAALFLVAGTACDLTGSNGGGITLSGRVLNAATQNPVNEAIVTVTYPGASGEQEEISTVTDSLGRFSTSVDVDEATDVTIAVAKNGVLVERVERVSSDIDGITDLQFELRFGEEGEEADPGRPTDIILADQSTSVIRVEESGGASIARLTFQVVDSTGTPIDIDQAVPVSFRFGQQPGGAALTPETVTTNGSGQATVNVSSGTTSGVVQVVAETEAPDGRAIVSKPVRVTIHGGLPNKCHFSLGPEQFNFAGLNTFGVTNPINVIVGDRYGNPVVPGTSVYFSSNAGVIGGSADTDDNGQGTVDLTSARPLPAEGVATIRAETVGTDQTNPLVDPGNCEDPAESGNENTIFDEIPVVFSGRTGLTVEPAFAALGQTYEVTLRDVEHGNPLAPGTTLNVTAEGTKVKAVGNTEVELDDTAIIDRNGDGFGGEDVVVGDGITRFTFRVVEDNEVDEDGTPTIEAITLTVSSPNGDLEIVLTPQGTNNARVSTKTVDVSRGAELHDLSGRAATVHATVEE